MLAVLALALSLPAPTISNAAPGQVPEPSSGKAMDTKPAANQQGTPQSDQTSAPAGTAKAFAVYGKGVQIYRCDAGPGASPQWVFVAPQADLFRKSDMKGTAQGTHSAGPEWRWNDGSVLAGTLIAKQAAPSASAIPWLLLSTRPTSDSIPGGQLQKFTYVRRSDTQGGVAPATGCTAPMNGQLLKVPYTATYTFYVGH